MKIKFSLVDGDEGFRRSLRLGLESIPGFTCVGSYAGGAEALAGIPLVTGHVMLMDIQMPGMNGIVCTHRLRTLLPKLPVVMVTSCYDHATIYQALKAGAAGYLTKPVGPNDCAQAIHELIHGGVPFCREAARAVLLAFRGAHAVSLSVCETKLMECLHQHLPDKAISQQMGICVATVRTHMRRMFGKFDVHSRAEAVRKCLSNQIDC